MGRLVILLVCLALFYGISTAVIIWKTGLDWYKALSVVLILQIAIEALVDIVKGGDDYASKDEKAQMEN